MKRYIGAILTGTTLMACRLLAADAIPSTETNALDAIRQEHKALRVHLDAVAQASSRLVAKSLLAQQREDEEQRLCRRINRLEDLRCTAYAAHLSHVATSGATTTNDAAFLFLKQEIDHLDDAISQVEDDVIEYRRLHRSGLFPSRPHDREVSDDLLAPLERREAELRTRMVILESEYPELTNAPASLMKAVETLDAQTFETLKRQVRENESEANTPSQSMPRPARQL